MASTNSKERKKRPIMVPAVKQGTYSNYLEKHPEVVDAALKRMGIDPEELDKLLLENDRLVLVNLNNFKNATITKLKEKA
ncbi:MAG: hypothetical protein ACE5PV_02790 [Candidatus Poribacteria bacterium]